MLAMDERGVNDQVLTTMVPVEVWGKRAASVSTLQAGQLVVVQGKLKRAKKNDTWETGVTGFDATPVSVAPHTSAQQSGRTTPPVDDEELPC